MFIEGDDETRSFLVFEPGLLEAETGDKDKPYVYVPEDGVVEWPLIIPLYADGERIQARSIRIEERETNTVILEADL